MDRRRVLASIGAMPLFASPPVTAQPVEAQRPATQRTASVDAAMALAAYEAVKAKCKGTFGVGGVLIDSRDGRVLVGLHNAVARDGLVRDPTAHGERQLIDWYYAQPAGSVPPPSEVILFTSLDPCGMCTGASLAAGFKVVVAAHDESGGVNYDGSASFAWLPPALRQLAARNFSYPEVAAEGCYARLASGAPLASGLFTEKTLSANTQALCDSIFQVSRGSVRSLIDTAAQPSEFRDLRGLRADNPIIRALRAIDPRALEYRSRVPNAPDAGLAPFLRSAMERDRRNGGRGNAVAYLDYFGNMLMCLPGQQASSRIHTAFMGLTRAYAKLRSDLSDAQVPDVQRYLHQARFGTFVFALGPGIDALSLMDLSAAASSLGREVPTANPMPFQYVRPTVDHESLVKFCRDMPPFYSKFVKLQPTRVSDERLVEALQAS